MPELGNTGNVQVVAAGGNVRLDVDPLLVALVSEHGQETGSNANGSWIRFANGVQVCWHTLPVAASNFATSPLYKTAPAVTWSFPQAFVGAPVCVAGVRWDNGTVVGVEFSSANAASVGYAVVGTTATTRGIPMLGAIGRWK